MPRDVNGTYTLPTNDSSPAAPRNVIRSSDFNELTGDYATALTDSFSRSGKGAALADLDMDGFDLLNPGNLPTNARAVNTGSGLTGGGDLSADRTIALAASNVVRDILDVPVYVADRTALKALDTTKDIISYLLEGDRQGAFKWTAGDFSAQVAADTLEGIYVKANAIAATAGAWVRVFDGRVFARWFGTGQAAVAAANAMADDITIDRDFAITSTATWGNGKNYLFIGSGKLSVATAVTLTIRGVVHAGIWQGLPTSAPRKIFDCTGTGKVIGIRFVKPEWWGAVGDGTTDDQPELQAAHDCVEASSTSDGGRPEIELRGSANYGLGAQLTLRPTANINLKFTGAGPIFGGSRFTTLTSFSTGGGTAAIRIEGNSDSIQKIAAFDIGNFGIIRTTGSALVGLWIGGNGTTTDLIGVQQSPVHDVHVDNFAFGFRAANCRLIDFNRCSAWCASVSGSVGCLITIDGASAFTGDLNFNDCQFVSDPATSRKCVSITSQIASAQIKGIRFNNVIFYKGDRFLEIYASSGGIIGDIWVNPGCQFDGFGNTAVHIESTGANSIIDSIFVCGTYIRGINNGQIAIRATVSSSGKIRDVHTDGNQIFSLGTGARAIFFDGVIGGTCGRNIITDIDSAGSQAILIDNSSRIGIDGNVLNRSGAQTIAYLVTIGAGSTYCSASNNIALPFATSGVVQNLGGVTNVVANNV